MQTFDFILADSVQKMKSFSIKNSRLSKNQSGKEKRKAKFFEQIMNSSLDHLTLVWKSD